MGIYLNPQNSGFRQALNSEIYVDKSEFINFTNSKVYTEQKYICVSRPRRFGKSITANMLTAYYSRGCDSKEMFSELKIASAIDFEKHLNKYNVIHFSVQDFLTQSDNMKEMLSLIEDYILEDFEEDFPDFKLPKHRGLMNVFNKHFAKYQIPFIFIIDEWDCVFRIHQQDKTAQKEYLDFLRNLLKDKSYVALAYMTGILPIKKYGEHSALNMFDEYSMTDASPIQKFTGFTEPEVISLCNKYNRSFDEIKKWYDGYSVNGVSVYNPRSVVQTLIKGNLQNYWTKTETYEALKVYIQMDYDGLKNKVERLIAGEHIPVNTTKFANDMTTFNSADDVLTLLIHLGYLTYYELSPLNGVCSVPNHEVQQEFINCIEDSGWEPVMNAIRASDELMELTVAGNENAVAERIEAIHEENASILQYNNETSLSCVIALAYYCARKNYTIARELPAGKGFADIVFIPHRDNNSPAMVIELKCDTVVQTALDQIKEKNYAKCFDDYSGEILLVGISYNRDSKEHFCKIEKIVK